MVYRDGAFTKLDRDAALKALHEQLKTALSDEEVQRRKLSKALPGARAGLLCELHGSGQARTGL